MEERAYSSFRNGLETNLTGQEQHQGKMRALGYATPYTAPAPINLTSASLVGSLKNSSRENSLSTWDS